MAVAISRRTRREHHIANHLGLYDKGFPGSSARNAISSFCSRCCSHSILSVHVNRRPGFLVPAASSLEKRVFAKKSQHAAESRMGIENGSMALGPCT